MDFKDEIKEQKQVINVALHNIYKLAALNGFEANLDDGTTKHILHELYVDVKLIEEL